MTTQQYDKHNPFLASIKERYWLSKPGSQRHTYHVVLNLAGSNLKYTVGDSIAIYPVNVPAVVERTILAMKANKDDHVTDKQGVNTYTLYEFLSNKANIADVSKKLIAETALRLPAGPKRDHLEWLLEDTNRDNLKSYIQLHQVWDFLDENSEANFSIQDLVNLLMPLLPRFYSIASSQMVVGDEIHLTVSQLQYTSNGHERYGVCTYYLCSLAPLDTPHIPIYIQPHHGFTLPTDPSIDIIMIGPGTGVAPFRAFMQERFSSEASGKNWLFFGEWHHDLDYYYQDFWEDLEAKGKLRINTAFSRDQEHKIYVQHRMWEHKEEVFEWLEKGAMIYVCGDAHHMAKDVDAMLLRIVEACGNKSEAQAKDYMKALRAGKRYLRDIY